MQKAKVQQAENVDNLKVQMCKVQNLETQKARATMPRRGPAPVPACPNYSIPNNRNEGYK